MIFKKIFRLVLKTIKWAFLILILLSIISALYNLSLPNKSEIVEYLSSKEKAYIAETINLQHKLGGEVWPGWSDLDIPVIVYNEKYAFLIGISNPSTGWFKMPSGEHRGIEWEIIDNDTFYGNSYYRQALPNSEITPENFTVKVGEKWVASMQTKEYAAIEFYNGFKKELPPVLNGIFPYKLFWNILMGSAETYIGGLAHEKFHAFQAFKTTEKFNDCESVSRFSSDYPWDNMENADGWIEETNLLLAAYQAEQDENAKELVIEFLEKRMERRSRAKLTTEMILYEQKREWLEGLAKYAELKICLVAKESNSYTSIDKINEISEFKNYKNHTTYFNRQIDEISRSANRHGESRFYYGGMLQAIILDRLMPEWKSKAFNNKIYLETLLKKIK